MEKTGKWIPYEFEDDDGTKSWGIKCSQCDTPYRHLGLLGVMGKRRKDGECLICGSINEHMGREESK